MLGICSIQYKNIKYRNTLQNVSPINVFSVERFFCFIAKPQTSHFSLRTTFFDGCLCRKDLYQRFRNSTKNVEQDHVHTNCTCYCIQRNCLTTTLFVG